MVLQTQKRNIGYMMSAVLLVLLFTPLLCMPTFAAGGKTGGLAWSLSGGTLTISGSGAMTEYTDSNMPPWSDVSEKINRIVVRESVTSIGSLAFYNCNKATSVTLPSSVTFIGDRAFKFCRSLTYISLPRGLTSIGEASFEYCESLNGLILPDGLISIGDYAFDRCTSLSHITIPTSVTQLGRVLFHCCTSLKQVVIECPIEKLPDCIFYGCTLLTSVSLPESVDEIGTDAFHECTSLSGVYYSGDHGTTITNTLQEEPTVQDAFLLEGESISASNGNVYTLGDSGVKTAVSSTENASITKTQVSSYDYTINGEPASLDEVLSAGETDDITATESSELTIDAVIHTSEGWNEVTRSVIPSASSSSVASSNPSAPAATSDSVNVSDPTETKSLQITSKEAETGNTMVNVQLENSEVTSRELAKLAGEKVTLNITTQNGSTWSLDESGLTRASFGKPDYDLDFSVSKLEEKKSSIKSETQYSLKFNGDTDFNATVAVPLKMDDARKVATLYQINGKETEAIQSVIVDDSGIAWFPLANVDSRTDYYVAVNASGVDTSEAVIPQTLAKDYGMDSTLMGMDGTQYRITGRSSRWGITGGQFAIYVAIGIGTIVLVVTLAMITYNKLAKSKARYALADSEEEIDEEAMRLEIMKELLEKTDRKE